MYQIMLRFYLVKKAKLYEFKLDKRLSFKDNFLLVEKIISEEFANLNVYDPNKRIFLEKNIPIENFNLKDLMLFELL